MQTDLIRQTQNKALHSVFSACNDFKTISVLGQPDRSSFDNICTTADCVTAGEMVLFGQFFFFFFQFYKK